jgi:hypothetical protein
MEHLKASGSPNSTLRTYCPVSAWWKHIPAGGLLHSMRRQICSIILRAVRAIMPGASPSRQWAWRSSGVIKVG